jgi:glycosyltransferase involved in cell wall biosynthesis
MPNDDAIRFFMEKAWPLLRAAIPDATLTVVGRSPLPWLTALASREPALTVTGRVDDVRPYLERASAFIVPIRVGGGTRLKIYEAMGMECPMVSTTIGAEGLPLVNEREILLADTPEELSAGLVRLLTDVPFARGLAERAARRVREEFGWDRVATRFTAICERLATRRARPSTDGGAGF